MDIDEFLDRELKETAKGDNTPIEGTESDPKINDNGRIKGYITLLGRISSSKLKWDSKLYSETKKSEENLRQDIDKLYSEVSKTKRSIKHMVGQALDKINNKEYDSATRIFSDISKIRDTIPDAFLEERKELNREIFLLHQKLHDAIDKKFINDLNLSLENLSNLIKNCNLSMDAGDIAKAKLLYSKSQEEFAKLPGGFLSKKVEVGNSLTQLYKHLSIQSEIEDLQLQISHIPQAARRTSIDKVSDIASKSNITGLSKNIGSQSTIPDINISNQPLLKKLIARKIDRAKANLKKDMFDEAKRNLDSILKVDPTNRDAKKLIAEIPVKAK
jgi:hypothetical protein